MIPRVAYLISPGLFSMYHSRTGTVVRFSVSCLVKKMMAAVPLAAVTNTMDLVIVIAIALVAITVRIGIVCVVVTLALDIIIVRIAVVALTCYCPCHCLRHRRHHTVRRLTIESTGRSFPPPFYTVMIAESHPHHAVLAETAPCNNKRMRGVYSQDLSVEVHSAGGVGDYAEKGVEPEGRDARAARSSALAACPRNAIKASASSKPRS